jgi:hypothetical protein
VDIDKELAYLQETQTAVIKYSLPKNIRPCVSALLNKSVMSKENGGDLGRQTAGLMIATDLRNNGIPEGQIKKRLDVWNSNNAPPLKAKEIKGILIQCFKLKPNGKYAYSYTCGGKYTDLLQFEGVCLGKETCLYYRDNYNKKGYKTQVNYVATNWQYILTTREQYILFHVIPELERLKKVFPGYWLITTYRELSHYTGIQQRYFKSILKALKDYGLIDYIPGIQRLWEHQGTKIRRVIPPPQLPREFTPKTFN